MSNFRYYSNGNTSVIIDLDNGTKIRMVPDNESARPEFPESIDCKISNRCNMSCEFCHEQSTSYGALANLKDPFFDSLKPYTELALGGGNIFEFNEIELEDFLFEMARKKVICNATVHLHHFIQHFNEIQYCTDHGILHGIGVSINEIINDNVITYLKNLPNVVVHVIAGVVPWETLIKLANNNIKLLILGYKTFGRGETYIEEHSGVKEEIKKLETRLPYLFKHFPVVSFDNLALTQLNVKGLVSEEDWNKYYMGEDAQYTMYVDMVTREFAKSSTSPRIKMNSNNIIDLFNEVRN